LLGRLVLDREVFLISDFVGIITFDFVGIVTLDFEGIVTFDFEGIVTFDFEGIVTFDFVGSNCRRIVSDELRDSLRPSIERRSMLLFLLLFRTSPEMESVRTLLLFVVEIMSSLELESFVTTFRRKDAGLSLGSTALTVS